MIEARNRPHPKRDRDEFTSEENTNLYLAEHAGPARALLAAHTQRQ
ncbi:hypothetical protein [Paraburkholderia xenovorans]|jgi:hypothetical protein